MPKALVLFTFVTAILLGASMQACHQVPAGAFIARVEPQQALTSNYLNVTVWVYLSDRYSLLSTGIKHQVTVFLDVHLPGPPSPVSNITISSGILFSKIPANSSYAFLGSPPLSVLKISIPANATRFAAILQGTIGGSSVLWKNAAEIGFLNILSSPVPYDAFALLVVPPSNSRVTTASVPGLSNVTLSNVSLGSVSGILVTDKYPTSTVTVLYEPWIEEYVELGLLITSAATIGLLYFTGLFQTVRNMISPSLTSLAFYLRRLRALTTSRRLLLAYLMIAMLMVSFSFSIGPDPRLKVYVLAQPNTTQLLSSYLPQGSLALNTNDEMTDLALLVTLGTVTTIIVADFVPPSPETAENFIFPALAIVKQIVIVTPYASSFAQQVEARFPDRVLFLNTPADLGSLGPTRVGFFGFHFTFSQWAVLARMIGVLSFVLVFLGLAFLSYRLIEVGKNVDLGFAEALAYVIFYFVFTQIIFMVTSVLLAMPLGLHASTSTRLAVPELLGLGGGSRPRLVAGGIGVLFGSLVALKSDVRLDKVGFVVFLGAVFFLLLDPLTGGKIFHEFVLLMSTGPSLDQAQTTYGYIRGYLEFAAENLGVRVSLAAGLSLGIVLFYATILPLVFIPRLEKTTRTLLFLVCAFPAASGAVRVADMAPLKTMLSLFPGIMTGLLLGGFFIIISLFERASRKRLEGSA